MDSFFRSFGKSHGWDEAKLVKRQENFVNYN